jgi:hypothetical protein
MKMIRTMNVRRSVLAAISCGSMVFVLAACNRDLKFDKAKWNEQQDPAFPSPYRTGMLADLTAHYKLKGIKYADLVQLLGDPDLKDSSSLGYKIVEEYGRDIDPVYTRNLEFTFSKDSVITSFEVHEWRKK